MARSSSKQQQAVVRKHQLITPFFIILTLHIVAILLFTKGFLLTRTELPHSSKCSDVFQSPCTPPPPDNSTSTSNSTCWNQPSVNRLIIIVFDALRFDFVAPSSFFPEKKPWMDKLHVMQKLAAENGTSAKLFKAIADPPTTSLQRLKALTTGGLPTFIDIGNNFGAPAIVEDNFIQQLVENGKRVVMVGDDTWWQLYPRHFEDSFPYPSFNVKDLDTVDNGCIKHLLPSIDEGNWDVLIAHFLGMDHAGHIFGVNTNPMIQKLEQYNSVLEVVVEKLKSMSGPGELHENTFLVVMGDHAQTLNGDHGGGSPEEVETSIFAMSFNNVESVLPPELDSASCGLNKDGKQICIGTVEQLDFAVTMSAMLGIPFPYGSIGRVDPQLYALGAGSLVYDGFGSEGHGSQSSIASWMYRYVNALCINAWQVKRYIDEYSASSVIGFPPEDLLHLSDIYAEAQDNWSLVAKDSIKCTDESCASSSPALKMQIRMYLRFLNSVVELARSKWTEFNLKLMGVGLIILFLSLFVQLIAIKRVVMLGNSTFSAGHLKASVGLLFAIFVIIIRAASFLSNSYILEEGKVAIFFLGTSVILALRSSFVQTKMVLEGTLLILFVCILRFITEFGLSSKHAAHTESMTGAEGDHPIWLWLSLIFPVVALLLLAYLLQRYTFANTRRKYQKYVLLGTIFCYMLISVHWIIESGLISIPVGLVNIGKSWIPRFVFAFGTFQLLSLVIGHLMHQKLTFEYHDDLTIRAVAMVSACSSTIMMLSGKQGSVVALTTIGAVWCIVRLKNLGYSTDVDVPSYLNVLQPVTQWSFLAVVLFFCTGHWCAFDGLRYGAAFIGFDEFKLARQAILLAIDTFGFSHILPILGLPLLVSQRHSNDQIRQSRLSLSVQLSQVFLMYGSIATMAVIFTVTCVTIQRRHLMVWGLFTPKYVFDVLGLVLSDVLICLASLYYIDPVEEDSKQN